MLDALRASNIYREDQQSYLLYPDRQLPRFLDKNHISAQHMENSQLLQALLAAGDTARAKDDDGGIYFMAIPQCCIAKRRTDYARATGARRVRGSGPSRARTSVTTFGNRCSASFLHRAFGYVLWLRGPRLHLLAHGLQVAAGDHREFCLGQSRVQPALCSRRVIDCAIYCEIRDGMGLSKTPEQYGAFPCDPYSHTPKHAGIQQPGMTGQVKEDILSRLTELGMRVRGGILSSTPFCSSQCNCSERILARLRRLKRKTSTVGNTARQFRLHTLPDSHRLPSVIRATACCPQRRS